MCAYTQMGLVLNTYKVYEVRVLYRFLSVCIFTDLHVIYKDLPLQWQMLNNLLSTFLNFLSHAHTCQGMDQGFSCYLS